MMGRFKLKLLFVCALVFLMGAGQVLGDWDPGDGHKMHWPQTPKPGGWDVDFYWTHALGDDWQCTETGLVTDIHFWASWKSNDVGTIDGFTVTIYDDDPCGTGGYSQPNTPQWTRNFIAGDFTVRTMQPDIQGWYEPDMPLWWDNDHDQWCQVNITHIDDPFIQKEGKIYWLVISDVNTPLGTQLGWKETDKNFNDDAVWGGPTSTVGEWVELTDPCTGLTMDLAFVITSEPLKHRNLKWSQPPIEIDPNLADPIYCGWDEESFLWDYTGSTLVYENWDANGFTAYYPPGQGDRLADDINLAGTQRKLDHYDFSVFAPGGTAPYTVTSELYADGGGLPGLPIPGTACVHNVAADGYVVLDCAPGSGAILPDMVWMVLTFDTNDAGWWLGEAAELGYTGDFFREYEGGVWIQKVFGGNPPPYAGFEANIWCESDIDLGPIVADDFRCLGSMPITSIHWWGSYVGWESPDPPPGALQPISWRIGFWSNVPAGSPPDPNYSYPQELLWEIVVPADRVDEEWVGYDQFPGIPPETCFQYYLQLEPDEYFWQDDYNDLTKDSVFWLSIAAIYPTAGDDPPYPWGWKTRPWSWMDDAVRIWLTDDPVPGTVLNPSAVEPIEDPIWGESYDVAFELDTDPNYIKHEQPFTGIRNWPHYEDELSMGTVDLEQATKWVQFPDLNDVNSIDVDATDDNWLTWQPQILADDFNCAVTGPITDIHIWSSWYHDHPPFQDAGAVDFTLSIYSDKPAVDVGSWSEPNNLLWSQDFAAGDFDVWTWASDLLEGWYVPCEPLYETFADTICYQYDFYIDPCNAFVQKGDPCNPVVYWLSVQARPMDEPWHEPIRFGWKTSYSHWNDDAVFAIGQDGDPTSPWQEMRYPVGHPFAGQSIDLAFEITTEEKVLRLDRLVADDWPCDQNTPITAGVWWGSYIGYQYQPCTTPWPRPTKPDYFLLNIWTDVPADSTDPTPYSHPNDIIWEYKAYDYDEVLVGYDKYPHDACGAPIPGPREPVFRYSVRLPEEAWFDQNEPNDVYWFSVVAVYDENEPDYVWGWTNHKHVYNDDAVEGYFDDGWYWYELYDQTGLNSVDMSFILFTDPGCQCKGDVSDTTGFGPPDNIVDIGDLNYTLMAMFAIYTTGDPNFVFPITPIPPNLDCMNVSDTTGFGPPDDRVDIGDLNYTLMAMFAIYTTGDPNFVFPIPCLP